MVGSTFQQWNVYVRSGKKILESGQIGATLEKGRVTPAPFIEQNDDELQAIVLIEYEGDTLFRESISKLYPGLCGRLTVSLSLDNLSIASR